MSIAYFAKQIQPGEKIKRVVYKSARMFLPSITFATLLIWASLFFYFLLDKKIGSTANWVVGFVVLIGIFSLLKTFMKLKYTAWVITNERLIDFDQKNFWRNDMNEVSIDEIHSPKMIKTGFWQTIVGCQTLRVFLTEEKAFLEINGIKRDKKLLAYLENKLAVNEITYADSDED